VRLAELVDRLEGARLEGDPGLEVGGVGLDSRSIEPGWLFAALPGAGHHGLEFLDEALGRGAVAVLTDRGPARPGVPWIVAERPRAAAARAAWAVAGDPHRGLRLIGVTGTNGKSTTADLVARILTAGGVPAAFSGTLGFRLPSGEVLPSARTTPEATELAPRFVRAIGEGVGAVVMEVSSHALTLDRIEGLALEVGVWTNLTRDHLDYHGDMECYFAAKRRMFDRHLAPGGRRILPLDDPWAARLLDEPREGDLTWGLGRGAVHARDVRSDLEGSSFVLVAPEDETPVRLPLLGVHNLRNAVAAAASAVAAGVRLEAVRLGLEAARPLEGRLERVAIGADRPVFVDYAHTPEGLRAVLQSLRRLTDLRLVVVFGAGGDRDRGKRGPMGFAAGELADVAIVTSDNPRSEDPAAIAAAVAEGVRAAGGEPRVVLDRRRAIAEALGLLDGRTLVLVAGKGHEATQTVGGRVLPFSDREVIRELAEEPSCG